ncbi:MAG TPA: ECF transporter S component [Methanomassiliicoccales archaeon]|nr:ECF transporter S component [Methanomassiliicoccales archaeon]
MRPKWSTLLMIASIAMAAVLLLMAVFMNAVLSEYMALLSFILVVLIICVIFAKFEESAMTSREVALIGILAAITAAARIPFAAIPNVQPCTFLIIAIGLVFGSLAGAMVGSLTAAISNIFLGQGPWTAWMMVAWSMVGIVAGYVGKKWPNYDVKDLVILGVLLGVAYQLLMDFSSWITFYGAKPDTFIGTFALGLPFMALHVIGNVVFAVVLGKPVLALFKRFHNRFHVSYETSAVEGAREGERAPGNPAE